MLVTQGLSTRTLDRETPVVVTGVLRDGFENSANPTYNNFAILPSRSGASYYYTTPNNGLMNEEDFVEKNISWVRLKDITLNYSVPRSVLQRGKIKLNDLSVFLTATYLFCITN